MHFFTIITYNTDSDEHSVDTTSDLRTALVAMKKDNKLGHITIKLLYYEHYSNPSNAYDRKKELERYSDSQIVQLIKSANPNQEDLAALFI